MKLIIGSLSTERVITGELEKLILSSIGNGQQDVAIDISNYVMDLNLYEEVGEFNNNIKKCAAVYIKDKDKISDHIDIENRERKTLDGLIDKDIVDKCIKLLEIDDIEYYNNLKNDTNSYYIFKSSSCSRNVNWNSCRCRNVFLSRCKFTNYTCCII